VFRKSGEKSHMEDLVVDGTMMLFILDWMNLAQDRVQWRALVNLRVP
jgi:hypothetical protein